MDVLHDELLLSLKWSSVKLHMLHKLACHMLLGHVAGACSRMVSHLTVSLGNAQRIDQLQHVEHLSVAATTHILHCHQVACAQDKDAQLACADDAVDDSSKMECIIG